MNFVDPTGEQVVAVAGGLDESATPTTAPETTAPATVDNMQAYDRPEEAGNQRVTVGIYRPGELSDGIELVGHAKWLTIGSTNSPRSVRRRQRSLRLAPGLPSPRRN